MRNFMLEQHRDFFEQLEYIFLGTVDHDSLPHASIITGSVGFVASPDPKTLVIQTGPRDLTKAFNALSTGQAVGVLGLDLSNRRRNRMQGRISAIDENSITITVVQSYGNCPKYINLREVAERELQSTQRKVTQQNTLGPDDIALISTTDTFFIVSYILDGSDEPYEGVDINHRGGHPGFVSVDTSSQITIPDYKGNYLFNTFGNLLINPEACVLFVDFETGDQLHIHGQATLIDEPEVVERFSGAQRLLRIHVNAVSRIASATPLRWRFLETPPVSPQLTSDMV